MEALIRFILRATDLLEAEGRAARQGLFRLAAAVLLVALAVAVLLAAVLTLMGALFLALWEALPAAGALAIVGGITLLVGLTCWVIANGLKSNR